MSLKMGFWSVFAIVVGSQVGSGVFMLPATLSPFGIFGLFGWFLSSLGALSLSLVFSSLCARFPKTGGPHVYVKEAFGNAAGFFTGWTYWIISWVSTTTVIVTSIGYLTSFLEIKQPNFYFLLQVSLLLSITFINLRGVKAAGKAEFFLGLLKVIPLFLLPICALFYFEPSNFLIDAELKTIPESTLIARVTLLTLWGFIGLETATAPAGSVDNPKKTIPRAIILGTLFVALLYILNYISITGMLSKDILVHSKAPYVDATQSIFGGSFHIAISIIASIICVGTLNAWVLTSGQIALGLGQDSLLPQIFMRKNRFEAPYWSILISSMGIIPLLFLTQNDNLSKQLTDIIDFSVIAFLFVYLISTLSFLKFLIKEKGQHSLWHYIYGIFALIFSSWVIFQSSLITILVSSLFVLSGLPVYFLWYRHYQFKPHKQKLTK